MADSGKPIDFNQLLSRPGTSVTLQVPKRESPKELTARLDREVALAKHERTKDLLRFAVALLFVTIILGFCLWTAVVPGSSPDDKKWATVLLSSIVSAFLGYLTGSKVAR